MKPITQEDLKVLKEGFTNRAKEMLLENGDLVGLTFLVAPGDQVAEKVSNSSLSIKTADDFRSPTEKDLEEMKEAYTILVLPNEMPWEMFDTLKREIQPDKAEMLDRLLSMSKMFGVDNPYMRTVRPFLQVIGLHPKDVLSIAIKQYCRKLDIVAIIKIDEAWIASPVDKEDFEKEYKKAGSVKDMPGAKEGLMVSMETKESMSLDVYDFNRDANGKLVSFSDPRDITEGIGTSGEGMSAS